MIVSERYLYSKPENKDSHSRFTNLGVAQSGLQDRCF